jgi:hypothetical protein
MKVQKTRKISLSFLNWTIRPTKFFRQNSLIKVVQKTMEIKPHLIIKVFLWENSSTELSEHWSILTIFDEYRRIFRYHQSWTILRWKLHSMLSILAYSSFFIFLCRGAAFWTTYNSHSYLEVELDWRPLLRCHCTTFDGDEVFIIEFTLAFTRPNFLVTFDYLENFSNDLESTGSEKLTFGHWEIRFQSVLRSWKPWNLATALIWHAFEIQLQKA